MEKQRLRPISEKQRQRIRQYAAANPQIEQRSLAQWLAANSTARLLNL